MERGSTKHGRQLDEALKRETDAITHGRPEDSRVQDWRRAEPSGEDQPEVHPVLDYDDEPLPNGMTPSDVDARAEIAKHLRRSDFPATRDVLLQTAVEEQSPQWIVSQLSALPADESFENMQDVWTALGHKAEGHRT